MFIESIDSEQLQKLEYASFPGKIQVIDSVGSEFNRAITYLRSQKIIGFDTETRPCFSPSQPQNDAQPIVCKVLGNSIVSSLRQLQNALLSIVSTPSGMTIVLRARHESNIPYGILPIFFGRTTEISSLQDWNAKRPMLSMLLGNSIDVNSQLLNAFTPITFRLLGRVIEDKPV